MNYTPQNFQAAHVLTHMAEFGSRAPGNQRPFPIQVQPYSSSGQAKQWVQTPFVSSFGLQQGPGWYSPAPQLSLPGQQRQWRKRRSNTRRSTTRRSNTRRKNTRRRR